MTTRGRPKNGTKTNVVKYKELDINDPIRRDFRNFLYLVWQHLGLPEPTKAQYRMARFIQNGDKRLILQAFRGIGKSYITVAYCAWELLLNPQLEIMVVSAGEDRAITFAKFLKDLINGMPMLQHLKASEGQRDSIQVFDVGPKTAAGSPSVKSIGITGQLTGSRADIIIADDVEILRFAMTHDQREKLAELVKEFSAIIKPNGKILYLGTPQTELSLYNTLETRGYQTRIYPAEYPSEADRKYYGSKLDPDIIIEMEENPELEGQPTDPKRFSAEELAAKKLEYGKSGYAMQFMLNTSLSDGNRMPLKINDLVVYNCRTSIVPSIIKWSNNPLNRLQHLPNVALAGQAYFAPEHLLNASGEVPSITVLIVDPSGRGNDETGVTVMSWSNGNLFWKKTVGFRGGYEDHVLEAIANIAKEFKVNTVVIESNFGESLAEIKAI